MDNTLPSHFPRRGGDMTLRPFSAEEERCEPHTFMEMLLSNRNLSNALRRADGGDIEAFMAGYMEDYLNKIHAGTLNWKTLNEAERKAFRALVQRELEWCPVKIEKGSLLAEAVRLTELEYYAYPP